MIDKRKRAVDKMCGNKKSFFSTKIASQAAAKIRYKGGPLMRWYQCPHCSKWHFTTKSQDEYREVKRNG